LEKKRRYPINGKNDIPKGFDLPWWSLQLYETKFEKAHKVLACCWEVEALNPGLDHPWRDCVFHQWPLWPLPSLVRRLNNLLYTQNITNFAVISWNYCLHKHTQNIASRKINRLGTLLVVNFGVWMRKKSISNWKATRWVNY